MIAKVVAATIARSIIALGVSGCVSQAEVNNPELDRCVKREIDNAKYITSKVPVDSVVDIAFGACTLGPYKVSGARITELSLTQKAVYKGWAYDKIKAAPLYRFGIKRDEYKGVNIVEGYDSVNSDGASKNFYTKASLSASKGKGRKIEYFVFVEFQGLKKPSFNKAYFKGGEEFAAVTVDSDVDCSSGPFCYWSESALVNIPAGIFEKGVLDFKLSGDADSDPVVIPHEYISMFMQKVSEIK